MNPDFLGTWTVGDCEYSFALKSGEHALGQTGPFGANAKVSRPDSRACTALSLFVFFHASRSPICTLGSLMHLLLTYL